ncbi:MAG TPA: hypothetical protein VIN08_10410 [Ohtaekwangia sp.]|uniref:hypothetical protein n=1 Tax=Ohtaekwangia sp. TaxID=2066019 RepID=UPI002F93454F
MDLRQEILREHSKKQASKIADYVLDNRQRFKVLVDVYLAGPYRVTQRAAWPLGLCVERNPVLIKPHLKRIIDYLEQPDIHDAVKRNTMRLLQFCDIPSRHHGQVVSLCFQYLQDGREPVAIKAFAMTVLHQLIQTIPDLKKELKIILEDQLPYASPAFTVRARKILKQLA